VNLFLRVVRRREDGFHDLASLFHVIDLGDRMSFAARLGASQDTLSCNMEGVPTDSSNLVIKVSGAMRSAVYMQMQPRCWRGRKRCIAIRGLVLLCVTPTACCDLQALDLFRRKTGSSVFFDVDLHKQVPHGKRAIHPV